MRYLHTMVRVTDLDASLDFYCNKLGMTETRRHESEKGRFTLVFLSTNEDEDAAREVKAPVIELTYNWDPEDYTGGRNFGHLAYEVDNIYDALPVADGFGGDHQPPAARRQHGLHPLPRRHLRRAAAEGRPAAQPGTLGLDGQHRQLVAGTTRGPKGRLALAAGLALPSDATVPAPAPAVKPD